MTLWTLFGLNAALVFGVMLILWLAALRLKDVSFIDGFWGLGMAMVAALDFVIGDGDPTRKALLAGLAVAWGVRLGVHLLLRWRREGADKRYVSLLGRLEARGLGFPVASLVFVFLLQGVLLLLVCLPVQIGQAIAGPEVGVLSWIGAAIAATGLVIETVADHQLGRFKADPANKGEVMDRGLWRYSRHPNYFGDFCVWWGLGLIACEVPWGWLSLAGPLFLTFTLLKWSGAPTSERSAKAGRKGYEDYIRRTSGFVLWPPKRA